MTMLSWRVISKTVTPMAPLVMESSSVSATTTATATATTARPRAPLQTSRHRAYHGSTPLSFRTHSVLQQKQKQLQQQQNHRRMISTMLCSAKSLVIDPTNNSTLRQQSQHRWQQAPPTPPSSSSIRSIAPTIHKRWHGGPHVDHDHADAVHISFMDTDGNPVKANVDAYVGESLLQVAQRNDIELEGACEGVCACSTCHVIIPSQETFDNLLEEASEDEEDMLDMAFGLTETSRLGCQILVTDEMDGMEIEVPPMTRNFYVDGHVPKPH